MKKEQEFLIVNEQGEYAMEVIHQHTPKRIVNWTTELDNASLFPMRYIDELTLSFGFKVATLPAIETRKVSLNVDLLNAPVLASGGVIRPYSDMSSEPTENKKVSITRHPVREPAAPDLIKAVEAGVR